MFAYLPKNIMTLKLENCKRNIRSFISLFLCLSLVLSPLVLNLFSPSTAYALISTVEEKKMGKEFLKFARQRFTFVEDDEVVGYVNKVGHHIVDNVSLPLPYKFQFFVIDNSVPNAFAVPGGYIFVHRGIMELMDNEGEFASILGHEIGHIQARHIAQRIARSKVLNIAMLAGMLAGVFLGGGVATSALIRGTMASNASLQLAHSRQDEREADHRGMENLVRAGYDPICMYDAMKKIWNEKWQSGVDVPNYLQTHPGLGERLIYIKGLVQVKEKVVNEFKDKKRKGQGMYPYISAILWGKYHDTKPAEYHFNSMLGRGNDKAAAYLGLGLVEERQGRIKEAIGSLKKAVGENPDSPILLTSLGRLYFQDGNTSAAIRSFEKALKKDHSFREAYYRMGRCYEEMGDNDSALEDFLQAVRLGYDVPEIKYHLGIVYGRLRQLAPAHEQLGFYYADKDKPNRELALFHLKKAMELYEGNTSKVKMIKEKVREIKGEKKKKNDEENKGRGV